VPPWQWGLVGLAVALVLYLAAVLVLSAPVAGPTRGRSRAWPGPQESLEVIRRIAFRR
jgi:hypothetical protein